MKNLKYAGLSLIMLISATGQKVVAAASRHEEKFTAAKTRLSEVQARFNASLLARMIKAELASYRKLIDDAEAAGGNNEEAEAKWIDWGKALKEANEFAIDAANQKFGKARGRVYEQRKAQARAADIQDQYNKAVDGRNKTSLAYNNFLAILSAGRFTKDDYNTKLIPILSIDRLRQIEPLAIDRLSATQNNYIIGRERATITGEESGCTEADVARAQSSVDAISRRLVALSR